MPQKKPFVLAPHRPQRAKPTAPSPFRIAIFPDGGPSRTVECKRRVQSPDSAMAQARAFAADVGVSGRLEVHERVGAHGWAVRRIATVTNSAVTGWQVV
jgi:hypothetical protein